MKQEHDYTIYLQVILATIVPQASLFKSFISSLYGL
jgi:hypothetical protein